MQTFEEYAAAEGLTIRRWDDDDSLLTHFANFYRAKGGLLSIGKKAGNELILDCFVIEEPTINAFAAAFDGADTIAVNSGVFDILKHTARAFASQSVFKPYSDQSSSENITSRYSAVEIRDGAVSPQDAFGTGELSKFANDIFDAAVLFVLFHEFAHINNGHIEYVSAATGLPLLAELNAAGVRGGSLERETLEFDADCTAVNWLMDWALQPERSLHDGRTAWIIPEKNNLGSPDYAMAVIVSALSMVIFYFAEDSGSYDPLIYGTHPHPRIRFLSASTGVMHIYAYRTGQDYSPISADKAVLCLQAWQQLFPDADQEIVRNLGFWNNAHTSRIEEWTVAWARMYDFCNLHKRGGTLAPKVGTTHPAFPTGPVLS